MFPLVLVIKAKIKERGLEAYSKDILEGYKTCLNDLKLGETLAHEAALETLDALKDHSEEYDGPVSRVTEMAALKAIGIEMNPYASNLPEVSEVVSNVVSNLQIVDYDAGKSHFIIKK